MMAGMPQLSDITASQFEQQRSLDFVKWLSCLYVRRGATARAAELFLQRWPGSLSKDLVTKCTGRYRTTDTSDRLGSKAAVAARSTTDPAWAGALTSDQLAEAFYAVAKRASLLGRIPGLRRIPIHVKVPTLATDANYAWVGEGSRKPVSRFSFTDGVTLGTTKALGIVVVTRELAELAVPGLEGVFRDHLIDGLTGFTDKEFLDPAVAAEPDVHPGSITNGTTPIAGTGDVLKDIGALLKALYAGRPTAGLAVLVMGGDAASQMTEKDKPLSVSDVITSPAATGIVVALDPKGVFVADNGIAFDVSQEAMVELSDAPAATAAAVLTSLFQSNLAGYRVERYVNWQALPGAVKYLTLA